MQTKDINDVTLPVTDIQRFCMHDGPGVRTTVFLKGCPLRCIWCHNPETQNVRNEILFEKNKCISCKACESLCPTNAHSICEEHIFRRELCLTCESCTSVCPTGALYPAKKDLSVSEILSIVKRDRAFYREEGGITLSGGEPLIHSEAVIELLKECKRSGITTCIETCGYFDGNIISGLVKQTDIFLFDVKDTNSERHKHLTGHSNARILENLKHIDAAGGRTRLRCILINNINTEVSHYTALAKLALSLKNCEGIEFIPYHAYGGSKMLLLGKKDNGNIEWIPSLKELEHAKETVSKLGIRII